MRILHLTSTLLPLTTALTLPNSNPTNTTLISPRDITAITMDLGTRKVNTGGNPYPILYNAIYRAITSACPATSFASTCPRSATSTFKVHTHAVPGVAPFQTDVIVHMDGARWYGSTTMYKLMVGAIAGAIERGTYAPGNCERFEEYEGGVKRQFMFCNTAGKAKIMLPGAVPYSMAVSLEAVPGRGDFECSSISSTVEKYLDRLKPEFQVALGMPEMYVHAECIYE